MSVYVPGYTTPGGKVVKGYYRKKAKAKRGGLRRKLNAAQIRLLKARDTEKLSRTRKQLKKRGAPG